ncbi:MAG: hypothetical protein IPK16_00555 [Anaerolineales bacterium]|nr:hypothetical protein [Anaerolineales bacterium]
MVNSRLKPEALPETVSLLLKRLMLLETCPPEWQHFDLYLFRDEQVVFYVGQSYVAFDRVWSHIRDGFKARSVVGRFVLANWPISTRFTIELWWSRAPRFASCNTDLNAAERSLIYEYAPCFNLAQNLHPSPLPPNYAPASAALRCSRSLTRLKREAELAVKNDERRQWVTETN